MEKILIVVDYQNDFVSGSLGFQKAIDIEPAIVDKIRKYRKEGCEVIFTLDTHRENYLYTQEGRHLPVVHCLENSEGWELYGKVKEMKKDTDKCFRKPAFGSSDLFDYLRTRQCSSIELCGVVSNICVLSNAVLAKAAQPEAEIIIDSHATASNDELLNSATLSIMKFLQMRVI